MQFAMEQLSKSKSDINKKASLVTFNSKRIKAILTARQDSDQPIIIRSKEYQQPTIITSRTVKYHRKVKTNLTAHNGKGNPKNYQNKALPDVVKPTKFEKTKEQSFLLKRCDKSKLIHWNKDLLLEGDEKYLVLSADLIIDQDCFWEKTSSNNGNNITTNIPNVNAQGTFNYNSTISYRNKNNANTPKSISLSSNLAMNGQQSKKNPLLNPNKLKSLIKEWKSLHLKKYFNDKKLIVLWMIRKQSTYAHLIEFVQSYGLSLHGIFYVKKKRTNHLFDLGLIVKEIHQKFFQAITDNLRTEQSTPKTLKSIQKNTQSKRKRSKSKSRELKSFKNLESSQQPSIKLTQNFKSITKKVIRSLKETNLQQNDQNCSGAINAQTCKEFQLSKKIKKTNITIVNEQNKQSKIYKKLSISSNGRARQFAVKLQEFVQKNQASQKIPQSTLNMSPLITQNDEKTKSETNSGDSIEQENQQSYQENNTKKYLKPEIFVFEGVKCNSKDNSDIKTYEGKIPLLLAYHDLRFETIKEKLKQNKIEFDESRVQPVKVFYFKYESIKDEIWETINSSVKELLKQNLDQGKIFKIPQINNFLQVSVQDIISQFEKIEKQRQVRPQMLDVNSQQLQLSEQQEEMVTEKTEKKLEQIKKQLINGVIALKGRNYTFENGQSIYYFVGDAFKRNYNMLFNQYYNIFEKEMRPEVLQKTKQIASKDKMDEKSLASSESDSTMSKTILQKLSEIQFYQFRYP